LTFLTVRSRSVLSPRNFTWMPRAMMGAECQSRGRHQTPMRWRYLSSSACGRSSSV
jgi:hypothetical protein